MSDLDRAFPPMDRMTLEQAGRYGLHANMEGVTPLKGPAAGAHHDQIFYVCPIRDGGGDAALCVSGLKGENARVLDRIKGWGGGRPCLAVNGCSVLVYRRDDSGSSGPVLRILEYETATGRRMEEHKVKADPWSHMTVCCRERTLFFVRDNALCSYDCWAGAGVLYRKAKTIRELRVWGHYVIFWAEYEKGDSFAQGWMAYDIHSGKTRSLDSSLSPEEVLTHPARFDPESSAYVDNVRQIRIAAFDTARGIYWADRPAPGEGPCVHYWQARSIAKGAVIEGLPMWRLDDDVLSRYRIHPDRTRRYFDGERLYFAPSYYEFYSCGPAGDLYEWSASNGGHGCCEHFYVFGDHLFLDVDARGAKVYPASVHPSAPLGESWLESPPPEKEEDPPADLYIEELDLDSLGFKELDLDLDDGSDLGGPDGTDLPGSGADRVTEKVLTASDVRYGILTFGSKFDIGQGVPIVVDYQGRRYSGKASRTIKGRVDGMTALIADLGLRQGDMLTARYVRAEGVIYIDAIVC